MIAQRQDTKSKHYLCCQIIALYEVHTFFVLTGQFRGEVSELDDAGTYFNLPLRKVTQAGTYHYMSTRNNNFSNRDQKGRVIVGINPYVMAALGWLGGTVTLGDE